MTLSNQVIEQIESEIVKAKISKIVPVISDILNLLNSRGFSGSEILHAIYHSLPTISDDISNHNEVAQKMREIVLLADSK